MPYLTVSIAQKMPKIQQMSLSTTRCLPATFGGRRVSWKSVICSIFCKLEISSRYKRTLKNAFENVDTPSPLQYKSRSNKRYGDGEPFDLLPLTFVDLFLKKIGI